MTTKKRSPRVDSKAAPRSGQDDELGDELRKAMVTLRQPKGVASGLVDRSDVKMDLKAELTAKELKFLEIYLTGECSIDKAMVLAGYKDMSSRNRYYRARQIVQKYEQRVGDGRKIMRAAGVGELTVALKIKEMLNDPSKTIQAKGVELAGKYLGMAKETLEIEHGITIVIKGAGQSPAPPGGPPGRPQAENPKALPGPAPISIIK